MSKCILNDEYLLLDYGSQKQGRIFKSQSPNYIRFQMGIPNALANQLQQNSRSTSETNNQQHNSKSKLSEKYEDYHPQGFEGHMSRQKQSHVITSTLP